MNKHRLKAPIQFDFYVLLCPYSVWAGCCLLMYSTTIKIIKLDLTEGGVKSTLIPPLSQEASPSFLLWPMGTRRSSVSAWSHSQLRQEAPSRLLSSCQFDAAIGWCPLPPHCTLCVLTTMRSSLAHLPPKKHPPRVWCTNHDRPQHSVFSDQILKPAKVQKVPTKTAPPPGPAFPCINTHSHPVTNGHYDSFCRTLPFSKLGFKRYLPFPFR